jgi:hypothetical protein
MRGARTILGTAALLAAVALPPATALAQGCSLCSRNLEQGGGEGLRSGLAASVAILVTLPVLLAGAFLWLLRRAERARGRLPGGGTPEEFARGFMRPPRRAG